MYLDAAHGGWLGWTNNIALFTKVKAVNLFSSGLKPSLTLAARLSVALHPHV